MIHSTAFRNTICNQITTDLGATSTFVVLEGVTPLATLPMSATAFGTPTNGQMTANPITPTNASASGDADAFEIRDSGGTPLISGTIGPGGDLQITGSVDAGAPVSVSGLTYTAAL